jgi:putative spermidine/putrescine transport system ATP-binding protein
MIKRRFDHLHMRGVSRKFSGKLALDSLDLSIAGGEFVALLGPSGCGKSTALNCLAGLLPLTNGSIFLDETRVDTLPPERRGFGMVFQNYALFPHLTVRGNVGFGLRMRGVGREATRTRVEAALRLVQLEEYANRLPGQLSGGQQQRVAIARAIVVEPPLVLMDEPLSNLDAALRLEMRTEIRRLHQELGLTTVYVTHDQEEALSLADRLVVLREGTTQQIGTPEQLYRSPANAYVASFMGYRNLFEADVTQVDGRRVAVTGQALDLVGVAGAPVVGRRAIVAIRPDDFTMVGEPGPGAAAPAEPAVADNTLTATVEVVEYHGREQAVLARLADGTPLRLRVVPRCAPGDAIRVRVPVEHVLVFPADASTGVAAIPVAAGASAAGPGSGGGAPAPDSAGARAVAP